MMLGPVGAAIGAVIGHQFDKAAEGAAPRIGVSFGTLFFTSTFEVMGHLAKVDGRVSEREIAAARSTMRALRLDEASVRAAIQCFTRGKQPDYDYAGTVRTLRNACSRRPDLLRIFFEIQMRAAIEGTGLAEPTRSHLVHLATVLGLSAMEFARAEAALRYGQRGPGHGNGGQRAAAGPAVMSLEEAYAVLEVSAGDTDAEVSKAYRRQLSRHHPDKLMANGLPESMLEHAKERTQQVIVAWERVRAARGMRG